MQPPVELSRLTILNIAAIVCYCLAILFHIVAFATDSWSSLYLDGVRWKVGLWTGCRQNDGETTWYCSQDVFEDPVFQTGKSKFLFWIAQCMFVLLLIINN